MDKVEAPAALLKAQGLANLLDTAVKIPFIGIRLGLDFLVGLLPGIGDAVMLFAALRIVYLGRKLGLPKALQISMLKNALLDFGLGFIPIVGDIFDLFYKANLRNVRIMERWWVVQNKAAIDEAAAKQLENWQAKQQ